jgi:hypothetical protein
VKVIGLGGIAVLSDRMRVLRGEVVTELAESMPPRGPIEPIVVRPAPGDGNGYWSRTVRLSASSIPTAVTSSRNGAIRASLRRSHSAQKAP